MKRSRFISLMLAGLLGFTSISFPTEVLGSELDIEAVEAVEVSDEEEALDYAYEDVSEAAEEEAVGRDGDVDWLRINLGTDCWITPIIDDSKVPEDARSAEFTYYVRIKDEDEEEYRSHVFQRTVKGIDNLKPIRFYQHGQGMDESGRLYCVIGYKGSDGEYRGATSNIIHYVVPSERLSSPQNVRIVDDAEKKYVVWDEVDGCNGYFAEVYAEGYGWIRERQIDENRFDLSDSLKYFESFGYDIKITALSGDITQKRCSEPAEITHDISFSLEPEEISLATGEKKTIKAVFSDESVQRTLIWKTSDPTIASVDQSGNVTAVGLGEAYIWAESANGKESGNNCKVTVYDKIKSIKLDPSSKTVNTGDEFVLRADVGAYTVTKSTIITTTGSTVEVGPAISFQAEDENLTIFPYGEGKVLVKAASSIGDNTSVKSSVIVRSTDGSEKEARCSVTINAKDDRVPLKTLGLNATSITICGGKSFRIYPVYTPSNATVDKSSLTYDYADEKSKDYITLDPVATGVWITAKQLPSGVSKATAKVKVSAADHTGARKEAICSVTVTNKQVMVSKINLSHKKISMGSNSHATLSATVVPAWADVTEVEWGQPSVPGIVSVFEYAGGTVEITALKPGTTKLTVSAKDGSNKSATCTITVGDPVESVSVKNKAKLDGSMLTVGKTITLKADAAATSGKPANPQVTWKSSDKSVAIVDKNGKVTAKNPGTVTITARSEEDGEGNYKTDSVTFKVQIPIKKIAVNGKSSISVYQGKIGTIQSVITPVDATNTQINWECSDKEAVTFIQPVTQGDEKLSFIAGKPGKFKITGQALDGSKKKVTVTVNILGRMFEDDVKLNIKSVPKGLVVNGNNSKNVTVDGLNASRKQSITLTPVLTPKAYNKNVIFTSSNPQVVEVDKKGKIKAVGEGSSRITMTTEDGNYTAICMVTTIKK